VQVIISIDNLQSTVNLVNDLMGKIRFPGYCAKGVMDYIRKWVTLMTGAPKFSSITPDVIENERDLACGWADKSDIPKLFECTEPWIDYVGVKAFNYVQNGRRTHAANFFDLPDRLIV
jgi:hypothetical protein